jgi:hypothetical protein
LSPSSLRSRVTDSLLRLVERKYVDSRSAHPLVVAAGEVADAGTLDLDDAGAEVAEHHPGVRPGEGAGQVDDEDAVQRSGHGCLSLGVYSQPGTTKTSQARNGPTTTTIPE